MVLTTNYRNCGPTFFRSRFGGYRPGRLTPSALARNRSSQSDAQRSRASNFATELPKISQPCNCNFSAKTS